MSAAALDDCLAQLDRTAAWLRNLPLARFGHADGAVEQQARDLVNRVHACVLALCRALQPEATGGTVGGAHETRAVDCPPADALPDPVGVHALGDQLAVHSADLARCASACVAAAVALPLDELDAMSAAALNLRAGG